VRDLGVDLVATSSSLLVTVHSCDKAFVCHLPSLLLIGVTAEVGNLLLVLTGDVCASLFVGVGSGW
jgi:hypothetical protein